MRTKYIVVRKVQRKKYLLSIFSETSERFIHEKGCPVRGQSPYTYVMAGENVWYHRPTFIIDGIQAGASRGTPGNPELNKLIWGLWLYCKNRKTLNLILYSFFHPRGQLNHTHDLSYRSIMLPVKYSRLVCTTQ